MLIKEGLERCDVVCPKGDMAALHRVDHFIVLKSDGQILGRKVPHMTIPVRPGRDMARLVEVAAMVQALRVMGHDSAKEFSDRLIQFMAKDKKVGDA